MAKTNNISNGMVKGGQKLSTSNYEKHSTKNPIGRLFLNNFLNTVVTTIRPLHIKNILDAGCGEGFTLTRLSKEKIGDSLEGVDFSKDAIEIGKKMYPDLKLGQADINKLPYRNNSFDLVIATEVLEHVDYPRRALRELIRVSNKYVLVTVPNEPWFTVQRILRGKNLKQLGRHPEHVQYWSSQKFVEFVRREKIKIEVKKLPFPWTMLLLKKK